MWYLRVLPVQREVKGLFFCYTLCQSHELTFFNRLNNLYINKNRNLYVIQLSLMRFTLWYEKIVILHLCGVLSCFLELAFAWLSHLWRHAYFEWCHTHSSCHFCVWLPLYYIILGLIHVLCICGDKSSSSMIYYICFTSIQKWHYRHIWLPLFVFTLC